MRLSRHGCRIAAATLLIASAAGLPAAVVELRIEDTDSQAELPLSAADASFTPAGEQTWLVYGRITSPSFSVTDAARIRLVNSSGEVLPLTVETGSAFSEFGDIIALTVAFEFDPLELAAGPLRLEWGAAVTESHRAVPSLTFPATAVGRIRKFSLLSPGSDEADPAQFATIEIIADSHADQYYLWYLLPMVVIFVLLVVRKQWNS